LRSAKGGLKEARIKTFKALMITAQRCKLNDLATIDTYKFPLILRKFDPSVLRGKKGNLTHQERQTSAKGKLQSTLKD